MLGGTLGRLPQEAVNLLEATSESAPALSIDPATLILAISMLGFLMAAVSWSTAAGIPGYRAGLIEWCKTMAAVGGGFLLYFLIGHAPRFLTFLVANVLVLSVAYFHHRAHAALRASRPRRLVGFALTFGVSGVLAVYFFDAPRQISAFTVSFAITTMLTVTALMIFRGIERSFMTSAWLSAVTALVMAGGFAVRAALSVVSDAASLSLSASSPAHNGILITGALFTASSSIGFFSMVHERLRSETVESARRDGLTGLYTRTAFFEMAADLDRRADPSGYSVVMLDIDHFKAINDTYGHIAGDVTIAHAARLIANSVRISDSVGRYGGEEFCVLLVGCGEQEAAQFSSRLVVEASQQAVRLRDGRYVSFRLSAGYATRTVGPAEAVVLETAIDVVERADQALYQAKRAGRNRAVGTVNLALSL